MSSSAGATKGRRAAFHPVDVPPQQLKRKAGVFDVYPDDRVRRQFVAGRLHKRLREQPQLDRRARPYV